MEVDHQFLLALRQLAVRVRGSDPTLHNLAYFRTPTDAEMAEMRQSVFGLLSEADSSARELIDDLLPRLDGTPLEDLAAIVAHEVGRELERINNTDTDSSTTWEVGIASVQILSKVLKAVAALENAYCQELNLDAEISHVAEVETAIEIRQAYLKFWSSIDSRQPEGEDDIEKRLRSASTAIARLRGRPVFLDLRALDRRLLLSLQRRIRDWLVEKGESESGIRLWQDLISFAELLRMINHRIELIEHDTSLIPELMGVVAEMDPFCHPLVLDEGLLKRVKRLAGRDSDLDELLVTPETTTTQPLFEAFSQMEIEMLKRMRLPQSV